MSIFNYFTKRKLRKERKRQEEIRQIRISQILQEELIIFNDRLSEISREENSKRRKESQHLNSYCPKCKSDNVNERIQRIKGEVNGSSFSSHSFLSSYHTSNIKGEVDTLPINKCNDCNHEWYKSDYKYAYSSDIRRSVLHCITEILQIENKSSFTYSYYVKTIAPLQGLSLYFLSKLMIEEGSYLPEKYTKHYNYHKLIELGLVNIDNKL